MSNNGKFMTQFYIILVIATIALTVYYMYQNPPEKYEFESISAKRKEIDEQYCQGPCRFINLVHVPEQETRAQLHVRHVAFTAGLINRTLVLPNVSGSRIGACQKREFSFYYNEESWTNTNRDYFRTISMEDYRAWLQARKDIEQTVLSNVFLVRNKFWDREHYIKRLVNCFQDMTEEALNYVPEFIWHPAASSRKKQHLRYIDEAKIVDFLRGVPITRQIDNSTFTFYEHDNIEVIDLYYAVGHEFSQAKQSNIAIPYSKELVSLAQSTSAALSPYVAVHWRMETISKEDRLLLDCARSLITQLDKQINHTGTLFLLTDYPHIFTRAQQDLAISDKATDEELRSWVIPYSDTFHYDNIGPVHHQAIQYLYEHRNVTLFGKNYPYSPPQWRIINAPETDHGFLGILDKLMAVNADAFLAGRPHVCARASTFTAQIQLERKNKLDESSHYFGYDI